MSNRPAVRAAFTLKELVLVVFILLILIGLFLPSVRKVRGAAARNQCLNSLKQIAIGCHSYYDSHGHFPVGTVVGSAKEPGERLSWLAQMLPHLEQELVYNQLDFQQGWQSAANKKAMSTPINYFLCPEANPPPPWINSNYIGVAGSGPDAPSLPLQDPRAGVFGYSRTVKSDDIRVGCAYVLLLLETRRDTGPWAAGGSATVRGIDPEDAPPIGEDAPFGLHVPDRRYLFERLQTAAMGARADGSFSIIPDTVDPKMLAALATIAGRSRVETDW